MSNMFDGVFEMLVIFGIFIGLVVGGGSCAIVNKMKFKTVGENVYVKYKGEYRMLSKKSYGFKKEIKVKKQLKEN